MANQRIFIKCRSCGKEKMLAKRLISAFHVLHYAEAHGLEDDWNEWFKVHEWGFCGDGARGLDVFDLVYEDPRECGEGPGG